MTSFTTRCIALKDIFAHFLPILLRSIFSNIWNSYFYTDPWYSDENGLWYNILLLYLLGSAKFHTFVLNSNQPYSNIHLLVINLQVLYLNCSTLNHISWICFRMLAPTKYSYYISYFTQYVFGFMYLRSAAQIQHCQTCSIWCARICFDGVHGKPGVHLNTNTMQMWKRHAKTMRTFDVDVLCCVHIYQTNAERTANEHIRSPKMEICGQYSKGERAMANAFIRIW